MLLPDVISLLPDQFVSDGLAEAVQLVALESLYVSVELCPDAIEVGLAARLAVGGEDVAERSRIVRLLPGEGGQPYLLVTDWSLLSTCVPVPRP